MTGSRARIVVASVAAVLMVTVFAGVVDASAVRGTTTTIRGVGSTYTTPHWSPTHVRIDHGTRVKWVAASYDHVLVAYGGNWTFTHQLPQGSSVTRRFPTAGTFLFRCRIHSSLVNGVCQGMCGKVVVH
ncbi:MAG: cupredoxin domain-containing protein [Acidimicrobiia bacterium]